MSPHCIRKLGAGLMAAASLLSGCGQRDGHDHHHNHGDHHDESEAHAHHHHADHDDHGHGDAYRDERGEKSSGASFKAGRGVTLTDETRASLGVMVAGVEQRQLPNQIPFTMQVYGEKHHHRLDAEDHSGCDVQGSGFISTNDARLVTTGLPVQVMKGTNAPLGGVVLTMQKALALGEAEVIIGVSNATTALKPAEFVTARIELPRTQTVAAIPRSALLRTSEGTFVYAVRGDAYLRTPVKVGSDSGGWVEIVEGLQAVDKVVTRPVETLWLIELRATKGGGHGH